jgi:syntaxin 5
MKDRTNEFQSVVQSMLQRGTEERPRLLVPTSVPVSEFTKASSAIAKDINGTMTKLFKLTQLAKKKSLFNDQPVEINDMIYMIKQDIAKLNIQITNLSSFNRQQSTHENKQVAEHSKQVVISLQSKLASASSSFKHALELRTQTMMEQKSRRDKYSFTSNTLFSPSRSPLYSVSDGLRNRGGSSTGYVILDIDNGPQQLMYPGLQGSNLDYINSRSEAIDTIESTIAELGQVYTNFVQILSSQRDMAQRIDDNVLDMEMNVVEGHNQLHKYFNNMSNNRWLISKVFAVLIVFFFTFVIVT